MKQTALIIKAAKFAEVAHGSINQLRKYTGENYIVHPMEVAEHVMNVGGTDEMIAAAMLHDTVEDTPVTIETIEQEFGKEVATLVGWLTDVAKPSDGNRATRAAINRAHIAQAPAEAQTIKMADILNNVRSLDFSAKFDKEAANFKPTYFKEKLAVVEVLTLADPSLREAALKVLTE